MHTINNCKTDISLARSSEKWKTETHLIYYHVLPSIGDLMQTQALGSFREVSARSSECDRVWVIRSGCTWNMLRVRGNKPSITYRRPTQITNSQKIICCPSASVLCSFTNNCSPSPTGVTWVYVKGPCVLYIWCIRWKIYFKSAKLLLYCNNRQLERHTVCISGDMKLVFNRLWHSPFSCTPWCFV